MKAQAPAGSQYPWVIDRCYSEFDSGAWLQNLQAAGICAEAGSAPGHAPPAQPPATTATAPPMNAVVPTGSPIVGEGPAASA